MASAVTRNLNKIIDVNYYPVETAERSNKRHRPIGLGVQVGGQGMLWGATVLLLGPLLEQVWSVLGVNG